MRSSLKCLLTCVHWFKGGDTSKGYSRHLLKISGVISAVRSLILSFNRAPAMSNGRFSYSAPKAIETCNRFESLLLNEEWWFQSLPLTQLFALTFWLGLRSEVNSQSVKGLWENLDRVQPGKALLLKRLQYFQLVGKDSFKIMPSARAAVSPVSPEPQAGLWAGPCSWDPWQLRPPAFTPKHSCAEQLDDTPCCSCKTLANEHSQLIEL